VDGNHPRKLESIVFDFDGTLAELRLDFGEMKRRLSLLAEEYLTSALSSPTVPALECMEALAEEVRAIDAAAAGEFQRRAEALIVSMETEAARQGSLFPFTRSVLTLLRRRKIKIAIITRNCEKAVRLVFPDLDRYCESFLSREHVERVKPDPNHLLTALRKVMSAPETALMVGDHPIDIQTGRCAGVLTAGVWSGNVSREVLSRSGARWTAKNCLELMRVLIVQNMI
jgi:phosphoglycolate phosphatase